jgi:hypothetical protein
MNKFSDRNSGGNGPQYRNRKRTVCRIDEPRYAGNILEYGGCAVWIKVSCRIMEK